MAPSVTSIFKNGTPTEKPNTPEPEILIPQKPLDIPMKTKVFKVDNSLSEVAPSVVYDCELRPQKKIEIALPVVSGCELALQPKIETSKAHDYPVILPTPPRSSTTVVPTKSAMTCGQPFLEKRPIPSSGSSSGSFTSEDEYEYDTTIETLTTTTVVKETTTTIMFECRKQLSSNADDILYGVPTIDDLLGFIAAERLRSMPHKGSAWDKVLKWAEGFSKKVDVFCYTIGSFTLARREGEQMVYGCCRTLLKLGVKNIQLLEKVFNILYQMSFSLNFFLNQRHLFSSSADIQFILASLFADIVSITFGITMKYRAQTAIDISKFDFYFGTIIDDFYAKKETFTAEVWSCSLREYEITTKTAVTIKVIREWLACQDRTLDLYLSDRMGTRSKRIEYTCEWFESELAKFKKGEERLLWVTGVSGSGKSVLATWMLENLRRTVHLRSGYDAISFTISPFLKTQQTTQAVVKGLLLQLLERSVGDISLFKVLSALYERTEKAGVTDNVESALWKAFDEALKSTSRLMIVVDGLDQLKGGDAAVQKLAFDLASYAKRHDGLKVILISRPTKPSFKCGQFYIDKKYNITDIKRYIEVKIKITYEFRSISDEDCKTITEKLSRGETFVWAKYALEILRTEKTVQAMINCLDKLPREISKLLAQLSKKLDFKNDDTRLIFSFLLAAERPLSVAELKTLLEIDVHTCTHSPRLCAVEDDIAAACGSLVTIRDGLVCFSDASIKDYILSLCAHDDYPLTLKDAHNHIVLRSLAYLKICFHNCNAEPDITVTYDSGDLIKKHRFFEYAARYWIVHYKSSTMWNAGGKYKFSDRDEFKTCFPATTTLALIEGSWWELQTCASEAFEMHQLALELRKACFGERSKVVIQCYLNLGKTYSTRSSSCEYYFKAWELTKMVCGEHHEVTRRCAKEYLAIVKRTVTVTTEIITKRSEMVTRYVYVEMKLVHGEYHEETIRWGKALAEILVTVKKIEESLKVLREVRKACVSVYGELHEETTSVTTTLTTVLTKIISSSSSSTTTTTTTTITTSTEIEEITKSVLETCIKTLAVWEKRRITATIKMVEVYEAKKELEQAKELLIQLRNEISEVCKHEHSDDVHEARIEITLQYCRFLKRHSRDKEAETVLIELWGIYKDKLHEKDCEHGDGLLVRIRIVGEEMKKWKIAAVAESVFSTLFGFYKRTGKTTTGEGTKVGGLLASEVGRHDHHSEEAILRSLYEECIHSTTTTTITIIKTTLKLCDFYERREKWSEAVEICRKSLLKVWMSFSGFMDTKKGGYCALPTRDHEHAVKIVFKLAVYFYKAGKILEAESAWLYVVSACRASLELQDRLILEAFEGLVEFYAKVGKVEIAVRLFDEYYEECREVLGVSHEITIRVTYTLATYCKKHAPKKAERYYLSIVTCTHGHTEIITTETVESTLFLCRYYEHERKLTEAVKYYAILFNMVSRAGYHICGLTQELVLEIYHKYIKLETRSKVIYSITLQFQESCVKLYGKYHFLTVMATIELAKCMETIEEKQEEAVRIYEEIRVIISEHSELRIIISEAVIIDIKKRLAHLYCHSAHSVKKAEMIMFESWELTKKRHGCSHEQSLLVLRELILFYKKQSTTEYLDTAKTTISRTIIEIFTREKDTQRLYNAGIKIAELYLELGLADYATEYILEIRQQVITEQVLTSKKFGFCLRKSAPIDRRLLIFITAFRRRIAGTITNSSYTELISDFLTESSLFESWTRALHYGGGFEASLIVGSRLRLFLLSREGREDEAEKITDELWRLFLTMTGEKVVAGEEKKGMVYELFLVCVAEMASEEAELTVMDAGVTAVMEHYKRGDFVGAVELAEWVLKYVAKNGGFYGESVAAGFKLAICLSGSEDQEVKCLDAVVGKRCMDLSRSILAEVLKASEGASFADMDLLHVDRIIALLGAQRNFTAMERILTSLWTSRTTHPSWSPSLIITLGTRLSEVRFLLGHHTSALTLASDIAYNLRRALGDLHHDTISAFNLLAAFHTTMGNHKAAMGIHEDVLRRAVADENEDAVESEEMQVRVEEMVKEQWRRLRGCWGRAGGKWGDGEREEVEGVWEECETVFPGVGGEEVGRWRKGKVEVGGWREPGRWGVVGKEGGVRRVERRGLRSQRSSRVSSGVHRIRVNGNGVNGVNGGSWLEEDDD